MKEEFETQLYGIGQKLNISRHEIKNTIKKRKKLIIATAIAIGAVTAATVAYLGTYYGGISIADFQIFKRFKFLQILFGRFL
jgi:hypothetical protein